ncbi:MAG TPA: Cof-type HAD-IIB family hydrolase [Caulobacteraceae bacterium]|nr:Cof-type HAD-IIB family hydrolase [Caulobacteraceae bacterium]
MSIRLLLADVDGTLVTQEKVLTNEARAAARSLAEAGIMLAITSGRPPRGMEMLIEPLALSAPVAGFNGGVLVTPALDVIECHGLGERVARQALDIIEASGLDAWLYTKDEWLIRDAAAPHVAREAWTVKFDARVVGSFGNHDLASAVKIVGVGDDFAKVAACERAAAKALGDQASAARSQPYYLDVTSAKANKGEVVRTLSRLLDVPADQIATIGDSPNDTLMFAAGGLSIAMGNAADEVKAKADEVTASNEDEGFAKAVKRFILPRAGSRESG